VKARLARGADARAGRAQCGMKPVVVAQAIVDHQIGALRAAGGGGRGSTIVEPRLRQPRLQ